jgi:hypothetical protein
MIETPDSMPDETFVWYPGEPLTIAQQLHDAIIACEADVSLVATVVLGANGANVRRTYFFVVPNKLPKDDNSQGISGEMNRTMNLIESQMFFFYTEKSPIDEGDIPITPHTFVRSEAFSPESDVTVGRLTFRGNVSDILTMTSSLIIPTEPKLLEMLGIDLQDAPEPVITHHYRIAQVCMYPTWGVAKEYAKFLYQISQTGGLEYRGDLRELEHNVPRQTLLKSLTEEKRRIGRTHRRIQLF